MALIKNIASSFAKRVVPRTANNIFQNEVSQGTSFLDRLDSAKDILKKAKDDTKAVANEFAGVSKVSRKFAQQIRSGKFGTSVDDQENMMMKSMGLDFGDLDNMMSGLDGDGFNNSNGDGSSAGDILSSSLGSKLGGMTDGDAYVGEKLGYQTAMQAQVASRQISLLSNIAAQLTFINTFNAEQTADYYTNSLDYYRGTTEVYARLNDVLDPLKDHLDYIREQEAKRSRSKEFNSISDDVLNPERLAKAMTDPFSLFVGENSPIKGMLQEFNTDPLGVAISAGLGMVVTNLAGKLIDDVKGRVERLAFDAQGMFEDWADNSDRNTLLGSAKGFIGNNMKTRRTSSSRMTMGKYEKEAIFDGQTKKAIVDVIPMYLSKILKAVSGADHHEVYDEASGRFIKSTAGRDGVRKKADDINNGNFLGGIGNELSWSLMGSDLTMDEQDQIRKKMIEAALKKSAYKINASRLDFGDENINKKFSKVMEGKSQKEINDLQAAFSSYKYEMQNNFDKLEYEMRSTGSERSVILEDDDIKRNIDGYGSSKEQERAKRKKRGTREEQRNGRFGNDVGSRWSRFKDYFKDSNKNGDSSAFKFKQIKEYKLDSGKGFNFGGVPFKSKFNFGDGDPSKNTNKATSDMDGFGWLFNFGDIIAEKFNSMSSAIGGFFSNMWGKTVSHAKEAWKGVTGAFSSISHSIIGEDFTDEKGRKFSKEEVEAMGFFGSVGLRLKTSFLFPLKKFFLGKDNADKAKDMTFFQSIVSGFDSRVLFPLKKFILGGNEKKAQRMSLTGILSQKFSRNIILPFKRVLMGDDTDIRTLFKTPLIKSIGISFDKNILLPLKRVLLGDDDNEKASKTSIWKAIGHRFDVSLLIPIKTALLGKLSNKVNASELPLLKAISYRFSRSIAEPLKAWIFGQENKKKSFFSNVSEIISPFFNKLFFGSEKAGSKGFMANLKTEGAAFFNDIWSGFKTKFVKPFKDAFSEFFGPVLSEFSSTIKDSLMDAFGSFKKISVGAMKEGGTAFFKTVFGDETVKILRENVVNPLDKLTKQLTSWFSNILKFTLRLPSNLVRGLTNTIKLDRIKKGRGNYSEDEKSRLFNLDSSGKIFDFMNMGNSSSNSKKADTNGEQKLSLFGRIRARMSGVSPNGANASQANETLSNTVNGMKIRGMRYIDPNGSNEDGIDSKGFRGTVTHRVNSLKSTMGMGREESEGGTANGSLPNIKAKSIQPAGMGGIIGHVNGRKLQDNIRTMSIDTKLMSPAMIAMSSTSTRIHEFLKSNLNGVGTRIDAIAKMLSKKKLTTKGKAEIGSVSFFDNPLQWIGKTAENILKIPLKFSKGVIDFGVGLLGKLASVPGKILSAFTDTASGILKAFTGLIPTFTKLISSSLEAFGKIATRLVDSIGNVLSSLVTAAGKFAVTIGELSLEVIRPLAQGAGKLTAGLLNAAVPAVNSFALNLGKAAAGLMDFAGFLASKAFDFAKGSMNFFARALGKGFGGGSSSIKSSNLNAMHTKITNFGEIVQASKLTPLQVFVKDGKIATYEYTRPKGTVFNDIDEARSLALKHSKEKADRKKDKDGPASLVEKLLGGTLGKITGALGGIVETIGGILGAKGIISSGKGIGSIFNKGKAGASTILGGKTTVKGITPAEYYAKKASVTSKSGGFMTPEEYYAKKAAVANRPVTVKGITPEEYYAKRSSALASRSGAVGVAEGAAGRGGQGFLGKMGNSIGDAFKGFTLKGALKGGLKGGLMGLGANMAVDTIFDKGTTAHTFASNMTNDAGWGAMIGSFVPVIGTAVGGMLGALVGAVRSAVPWFEKKFSEQIQNTTNYFLEIPKRLEAWVQELPERMNNFANSIPSMIENLFVGDPTKPTTINEQTGEVEEARPSLLGRLFSAVGSALWTVVKNLPKIMGTLIEGVYKSLAATIPTILTMTANGLASLASSITTSITSAVKKTSLYLQHKLPNFLGGLSDEDYASGLKKIDDDTYKEELAQQKANQDRVTNNKNLVSGAVDYMNKNSLANKIQFSGSNLTRYNEYYKEAVTNSKDDKEARLAFAKKMQENDGFGTKLDQEAIDKEFDNQKREEKFRSTHAGSDFDVAKGGIVNSVNKYGGKDAVKGRADVNYQFTSTDIDDAINQAADKYGIPRNVMHAFAQVESSKNPKAMNKYGYMGLFQMGGNEFGTYSPQPFGNPLDPYLNSMAAGNYMAHNAGILKAKGIPVTPLNLYLMHQQGPGGFPAIYNAAMNGGALSDTIKRNMMNNPAGKATSDPKEFLASWDNKIASKLGSQPIYSDLVTKKDGLSPSQGVSGMMDNVKPSTSLSNDDASNIISLMTSGVNVADLNTMVNNGTSSAMANKVTHPMNSPMSEGNKAKIDGISSLPSSNINNTPIASPTPEMTNNAATIKQVAELQRPASQDVVMQQVSQNTNTNQNITSILSSLIGILQTQNIEVVKQSGTLEVIAENTGKTAGNFFTGGSTKSVHNTSVGSNNNGFDNPDGITAGKGARLVATGGARI